MASESTTPTVALSPFGDDPCSVGYPRASSFQEPVRKMSDDRQYAPATLRNRDFILDVLRDVLPLTGVILEIASGSGERIVHFARNFPALVFQPSDPEPAAPAECRRLGKGHARHECARAR